MKFFILSVFTFLLFIANSQTINYKYGKVSKTELLNSDYGEFNGSDAIYLYRNMECGVDEFYYHYRIKIVNKKALNLANWKISYDKLKEESISYVLAQSYTLENGKMKISKLKEKDIIDVSLNDSISSREFTIPNVKIGSIIELKFYKEMWNTFEFEDFNLQCEYPVLKARVKSRGAFFNILGDGVEEITIRSLDESNGLFTVKSMFYLAYNLLPTDFSSNYLRLVFNKRIKVSEENRVIYKVPLLNRD